MRRDLTHTDKWRTSHARLKNLFKKMSWYDNHISQCLKITEKVPFNIASEASYFYILTGQKLIKKAKNGPFWRVFDNLKLKV